MKPHCIELLENLHIPTSLIKKKNTMKAIHQIAIKYLTYLVLNTRKLDNKQEHSTPPPHIVHGYQNNVFYFIFLLYVFTNKSPPTTR